MGLTFEYDIFLSHALKDREVALDLARRLTEDGLHVWLQDEEIKPKDSFTRRIKDGVTQSETLLILMSPNYFTSVWGFLEHHSLLFRDPTYSKRRFLPILIADCTLPDIITHFSYIDWRQPSDEAYEKLLFACQAPLTKSMKLPVKNDWNVLELVTLEGHTDSVRALSITPDGQKVVSGSWDTTLKIWNLKDGQCLATLRGHRDQISSLVVTSDGNKIVSGSKDGEIMVWDLESESCLISHKIPRGPVHSLGVTQDCSTIVSLLQNSI